MDDELRQIREAKFNHVIAGLAGLGLTGGLLAAGLQGLSAPWLWRSAGLLLAALVAFGLRRISRPGVATGVLLLELIGLVVGLLLDGRTEATLAPYLLIPIGGIAALLLNPQEALGLTFLALALALLALLVGEPVEPTMLLPPFGLTLVVALLVIESERYLAGLGERLVEGRYLLRQRTRELLGALRELDKLYQKTMELEQQVLAAQAGQPSDEAGAKGSQLYLLLEGALQELDGLVRRLRHWLQEAGEAAWPEEQAGLLDEAWGQIDFLSGLLVNLAEMARLDDGQVRLSYQAVNVGRLVNEVAGVARGLAREKPIEVVQHVAEDVPLVPADPGRLRQALLQVVNNALTYTERGTIDIQAELSDGELLIFVSDTGLGMYQEEKEQVFEPFGRGSSPLARQRQGAGLGLAISRRLIELHGGRMWATSALGVGSTFYLALPLVPPQSADADQTILSSRAELFQPAPLAAGPEPAPAGPEAPTAPAPRPAPAVPVRGARFGPVARFSSTYASRFILIIVGVLVLSAGLGAALAVLNGPAGTEVSPTPTTLAGPVEAAVQPAATQPVSVSPTLPPVFTATPPPPPAFNFPEVPNFREVEPTFTVTPTSRPALLPTAAPVVPTASPSPTPAPPSPSPTASPTATRPSPSPTASPTAMVPTVAPSPSPLPASLPSPTAIRSAVEAASTPLTRPAPPLVPHRLAFIALDGQVVEARLADSPGAASLASLAGVDYGGLSLSPDGRKFLFTARGNGDLDLYLGESGCFNPDAACQSTPVGPAATAGDQMEPAWSPDGQRIAFSSGRGGNLDIYVLDAGCALAPAGCPAAPVQLTTSRGYDEWPTWSPDGQRLAFVSDRDGNVEVYVMDAGGGNEQRVTTHPAADWPVVWSPDGRWLLFASNRDGNWNLYLAGAGCPGLPGGCEAHLARLTGDPADERDPAWSPDGRSIAFASNRDGNWDIYSLPFPAPQPAGEVPAAAWTQVTATPGDERYPIWMR